jgi:hypothetical protein
MADFYANEKNDVYIFLKENNLELYWTEFDRQGYDDMNQLLNMTELLYDSRVQNRICEENCVRLCNFFVQCMIY